ncbi:hypothetical protein EJ07DRAFT_151854 [Lizonia empirigonia]|nr:hypothetical protein EJ07DRAFT_151854 [Lizonia empirigonia]
MRIDINIDNSINIHIPIPPQPHLSNAALHALETHHLTHRLRHDIDDILAVYTAMATDMCTDITFDTPTSIDVAPDPPITIDVGGGRAAPTDAVTFTRPKLQRFKDTPPPPPSYDKLAFGKEVWEGVGRGAFKPAGRGWERLCLPIHQFVASARTPPGSQQLVVGPRTAAAAPLAGLSTPTLDADTSTRVSRPNPQYRCPALFDPVVACLRCPSIGPRLPVGWTFAAQGQRNDYRE